MIKRGATSDDRRVRPMYVSALCGALALCLAQLFQASPVTSAGPGPLSPSHRAAKLTCRNCHGADSPESSSGATHAREACETCHGAHPSTRTGHSREGLGCPTCHSVHGGEFGARFSEEGAVYFSSYAQSAPAKDNHFRATEAVVVPLIPTEACAGCHDKGAPLDPFQRCFDPLHPELSFCFDEHAVRRVRGGDPVCAAQHATDRPQAWDAATQLAKASPEMNGSAPAGRWLSPLAFLVGSVLGYVAAARRRPAKIGGGGPLVNTVRKLPVVNASTCLGCNACVDACPYGVIEVINYVAEVVRPDACCGLTLCEQRCPNGSLKVEAEGFVIDRPRLLDSLESSDVERLFLAGDASGTPLIKNAIHQGRRAASEAGARLRSVEVKGAEFDLGIIGAGPAGLSATLRAKELGLRAVTLEQGSVAQSILNFPRGKLIFDQPLDLPLEGALWMKSSTKEELLLHWRRILRKHSIKVLEHHRMTGVTRIANGNFELRAEHEGEPCAFTVGAVIVAIGQRGSPKRLSCPIADSAEANLHYHLRDARAFAGKRCVVIGMGDVAMEAAISLAAQPGTSVTILSRGATYQRGQKRNIDGVRALVSDKRIQVRWSTEVTRVDQGLLLSTIGPPLPFDAVFVMIGAIAPDETLRSLGFRFLSDPPATEQRSV